MIRRGPSYGAPAPMHRGPLPPPPPAAGQISNVTNSNDFASKNSRVFVGNLNTFALTKEDVDRIFCQYGMVTGISMHKGYAFVQYSHPGEARRSVAFENGNSYGGQILDLNVVSEPKKTPKRNSGPGQIERRLPQQANPVVPSAAKRPRQDSNPSMQRSNLVTLSNSSDTKSPVGVRPRPTTTPNTSATRAAAAAVKRAATVTRAASATQQSSFSSGATVAPGKDVLICGVCKMQFTSLHSLAQHKKIPCRLRTSCQCQTNPPKPPEEAKELDCATCDAQFDSAWALCQHCQKEHNMKIFKSEAGAKETAEEKKPNQDESSGTKKGKTDSTTPVKK